MKKAAGTAPRRSRRKLAARAAAPGPERTRRAAPSGEGTRNRRGHSPTVIVRPAIQGDIAAIAQLDAHVTSLEKSAHWQELLDRSRSRQSEQFFLVAVTKEPPADLLGFIVGEIRAWEFGSAPCGWVYALSVSPGARELGVGEALLGSIAERFRRAGVTKMRTMVAKDNPLPMLFFRGEGMMAGPYIQLEKDLE